MIPKRNAHDDTLLWRSAPYYVTARFREVGDSGGSRVLYVEVAAGGRILPHAERAAVWLFCLEGGGIFMLDDESTSLREGDVLRVAAGQIQGLVNDGTQPLRLLVIQQPTAHPSPFSLLRALLRQ